MPLVSDVFADRVKRPSLAAGFDDGKEDEVVHKILKGSLLLKFDNGFGDLVRDAMENIGG